MGPDKGQSARLTNFYQPNKISSLGSRRKNPETRKLPEMLEMARIKRPHQTAKSRLGFWCVERRASITELGSIARQLIALAICERFIAQMAATQAEHCERN